MLKNICPLETVWMKVIILKGCIAGWKTNLPTLDYEDGFFLENNPQDVDSNPGTFDRTKCQSDAFKLSTTESRTGKNPQAAQVAGTKHF